MTTTTWIITGLAAWLIVALLLALLVGRAMRNADRLDRTRTDFEMWRDELDDDLD